MREIMLTEKLCGKSQLLLMAAQRAENLEKIILPHLNAHNTIVLSERFHDSTFAYQGFGNNMVHEVMEIEKFVLKGFAPHHTLFLDATFEESERRLRLRTETNHRGFTDVFEDAPVAFRKSVFAGYQERILMDPNRFHLIDAMRSEELVAQQVIAWANSTFEKVN
jgi:dTMP kinase